MDRIDCNQISINTDRQSLNSDDFKASINDNKNKEYMNVKYKFKIIMNDNINKINDKLKKYNEELIISKNNEI
jgi:hypothetical protein